MKPTDYKNAALSIEKRVESLLSQLTLDEKCGQLLLPLGWKAYSAGTTHIEISPWFKQIATQPGGVGGLYALFRADAWTEVTLKTGLLPAQRIRIANELQKFAISSSRLGIPLLFHEECMHGFMALNTTVFPTGIGMGSTWDKNLVFRMGVATATELHKSGAHIAYGPDVDIVKDPRWSRTEETFGEDPWLAALLGKAMVKGLQQNGTVAATLKHFAAYGAPEGGHNGGVANIGERELRTIHLKPFELCIQAGAHCIMVAYNEIDGMPCICNKKLLTDILRAEWGFKGVTISDCGSISLLKDDGLCPDLMHAAAMALKAGTDCDMHSATYADPLKLALNNGLVTMADIDAAVANILRIKLTLGLFDNPFTDTSSITLSHTSEHRQVALELARRQVVMLKNNGILPLGPAISSVAVIGPNADNAYNQLGDYTTPQRPGNIVTVLDGCREIFKKRGVSVEHALGCNVRSMDTAGFAEAKAVALRCDASVVVLGGSSARNKVEINQHTGAALVNHENMVTDMECGEGFDRATLSLAGVQMDLLKELKAIGKPLVVVVIAGRPLLMQDVADYADALLYAWYPGCEGGTALAEIIAGVVNPSGKLPISFPKHEGQLPVYYYHKPRSRHDYVCMDSKPLFNFGFGLSYTTFVYKNLTLNKNRIYHNGSCTVTVDVTNGGNCAGEEVVQLYIRDEACSVTRPVKELRNFERIMLQPGETKTVTMVIGPAMLSCVDADMATHVEPGDFTIMVGGSLGSLLITRLTVVDN